MTKITFYKKQEYLTGFEVSGHTGFEEEGKDILCAAISTATQMTILGLKDELHLNPKLKISDGYLKLNIKQNDVQRMDVQLLMKTCLDALKSIIKNKQKYVNLEVKEDV